MDKDACMPLVSIVVRSMGRPELRLALESIAAQDYPRIEIVLVDATGGTHPPLPDIGWRPGHVLRKVGGDRRLPRPLACNVGLDAVHGDWFSFLDDDDVYEPHHVSTLIKAARKNPDALVVYGQSNMLGPDGRVEKIFGIPFNRAMLYYGPLFYWQASLIARKVRDLGCQFDEALEICEDRDFLHQIAEHGDFVFVPIVTFNYRPDLGTSGTGRGPNWDAARMQYFDAMLRAKWAGPREYHTTRAGNGVRQAIMAYARGDVAECRRRLEHVLSEYPDDPNAMHAMARLNLEANRLDVAESQVRCALRYIRDAAEFHYTHALILEGLGDLLGARQAALRARIDPAFKQVAEQVLGRLPVAGPNEESPAKAGAATAGSTQEEELFVLCRPHGGLNDTFCQIEKCWEYAERFGRTLIIDTRKSGLFGEFADFFSPVDASIKVETDTTRVDPAINSRDCYPPRMNGPRINGTLDDHDTTYSTMYHNHVDRVSGALLTFDFDRDYRESVLIHEQCGGGELSFSLLNRISLSENVRSIVLDRIAGLGGDYVGIHVRNTDYQTDYESLFNMIYPEVVGKSVLICSDDADVIAKAKNFFRASTVLSASEIFHMNQKPLHGKWTMKTDQERKSAAIASIVDLCALGLSGKLYFTNVTAGHPSGFSNLARHLNENKKLVFNLLRITNTELIPQ
ncbi:MAG: glycosyltransferase [Thiobacillus sp.]|nr:glycosyltransferase [Thiobacillus sp.]